MSGGREEGKGKREKGRKLASSLFLLPFSLFLLPALAARPAEEDWTVMLSGDADGYLAPCGCTSPMQGGLKRRATALRGEGRRVLLDNGGMAGGTGRQRQIKAETAAQALKLASVDVANMTGRDAFLATQLMNLSDGRFVSTSLLPNSTAKIEPWREVGPFLVGGATKRTDLFQRDFHEEARTPVEAAHRLVIAAEAKGLAPILLFDGDRQAAAELARTEPSLRMVTYHATGQPPNRLDRIGQCALASPGEHGKNVARFVWREGAFISAAVETLGPEVGEDKEATELYKRYLSRITREDLLKNFPRNPGKAFSGAEKCGSCHADALKTWRASGHSHALATLEKEGHDRDPDCVSCHVTGLDKTTGFLSRLQTPKLANVGCESCHGAGAAHSASPFKIKLPKVGQAACAPCHTLENSPKFDFATYWPRVKHGR